VSYAKEQANQAKRNGRAHPQGGFSSAGQRRGGDPEGRLEDVPGIVHVLHAIAASGDALIVGRTSDGGTWALTLLTDRGPEKAYAYDQEQLNDLFAYLAERYPPANRTT
jgi:hypothetical protein